MQWSDRMDGASSRAISTSSSQWPKTAQAKAPSTRHLAARGVQQLATSSIPSGYGCSTGRRRASSPTFTDALCSSEAWRFRRLRQSVDEIEFLADPAAANCASDFRRYTGGLVPAASSGYRVDTLT